MGQVQVNGQLLAGPPGAGGSFPSATVAEVLGLLVGLKSFTNASGVLSRTVSSPGSFVTLPAVGAGADVPTADTLYFKSDGPVTLELTLDDGLGGDVVLPCPVHGLVLLEFPSDKALKGLRVKGDCRIVYFVSGP